jgi:sugar transferase (PEP-CTERM/EpsH1 system associated)
MAARLKILYLVHRVPYPPNRGDRIRSFHVLDFLSARADVYLATLADEPVSPDTVAALQQRSRQVAIEPLDKSRWRRAMASLMAGRSATEGVFWSPRLSQFVRQWTRDVQFDAVAVFCSSMAPYLFMPELDGIPAIVDLVDVDSEKLLQYADSAKWLKRKLYSLEGHRLRELEKTLTKRASAVVLVSEAEAALWRSIDPNDRTHAIPNGVDLDYFQPAASDGRPGRCIFVGALDYPPNIDAVCWFTRHVWPEVRRQCPHATFAIVGRNPHPDVRRLGSTAGVEVIGAVADVRPHLAEASIAVAPLRIARGIQNKVLEAMAAGRPVIASPEAIEGLEVVPQQHVIGAQSPSQWSSEIMRLCENPDARQQLACSGRRYVEQRHNWAACLAPLEQLISASSIWSDEKENPFIHWSEVAPNQSSRRSMVPAR